MSKYLAAAVLILSMSSQSVPTALEEFTKLGQQAHSARQSGDKRAYLSVALEMQELLNDAPDAIEAAAEAYAGVGDTRHALADLTRFAELGQADDNLLNGKTQSFSILLNLPQYKTILERFVGNKTAVSRAEIAFALPDPGILAEDIAYDPQSKSFLITSVLEKKIIRIASDGRATEFASSPSHWPMLAIKVDSKRSLVWATEVAMNGFNAAPKSDWGRSAVLCLNLQTGAVLRRIEGPARSALGDMVLAQEGDPIISDGDGGGVYRVIGSQLKRINERDFISPQTSAMLPDGKHVLVPDYARGIGILDLNTGDVIWLNQDQGKKVALNGIDGLYFDRGSLILTQNGTSPERVVRLQLDKTFTHILSEEFIERATPTLGDPTHGVIVGDSFFYIANSGWSNLDEHGETKAGLTQSGTHYALPASIAVQDRPKLQAHISVD